VGEQFNRAAHHAGLQSRVAWARLALREGEEQQVLGVLRALLKRFGPEEAPEREPAHDSVGGAS
jgi:hypothetical protein